jgi:hypothetical protein
VLTGAAWIKDPATGSQLYSGEISGTHQGNSLTWTVGLMSVVATVSGSHLIGTLSYGAWGDEPKRTYPLDLTEQTP